MGTLVAAAALLLALAAPAQAVHNDDQHSPNTSLLFQSQNATNAINSDQAFWGDRAYEGNYDGFRIFDISDPANPDQLVDFRCFGPQNDPIVWKNKLLFLAVDRTLTGPDCGSPASAHDDPEGWEGVRIFDVSNQQRPRYIDDVYTDCGAHTISLYPKSNQKLMLYVSSYPLRPGPTCGPVNGPPAGNSPLHEKISVISVPVNKPENAKVKAQPRISYPGDPDGTFDPAEHGLTEIEPGVTANPFTACHDIGVFVEKRLAAAACAEQTQLWRIKKNGVPITEDPVWFFDDSTDEDGAGGGDVAVDFWHTARFTWDGKYVQADDESFGIGCPPTTPIGFGDDAVESDTGRPHFIRTSTGQRASIFNLPRSESSLDEEGNETAYCTIHQGNMVNTRDGYLSVNAWYMGGIDVIDWTDPASPQEVAYYDIAPFGFTGSDNWSAYWYEGPSLPGDSLTLYGTDGVHNPATGKGFQVFRTDLATDEVGLGHLNPQTQEDALELSASARRKARASDAQGQQPRGATARVSGDVDRGAVLRRLAP